MFTSHPRPAKNWEALRIFIGPREIGAGQMQLLAEALRRKGCNALAVNYYADTPRLQRVNDVNLNLVSGQRSLRRAVRIMQMALYAIPRYDVFHFFFGESLLPDHRDLPLLKRLGKKVFVHFRGSDIRQRRYLDMVAQRKAQGLPPDPAMPPSSPAQVRLLQTWRKYADGIFVSIPELLEIVTEATLVPQTIDLSRWDYTPEDSASAPKEIIIAHPATDQGIKGTRFVVEAVEKLKSEGYPVRLLVIENTPHEQVKALCGACHIGVDELVQGSYGNVAIELMALGKPVVAHLIPWYAQNRPDLPIVNATPLDLAEKLRPLVESQQLRLKLGAQGRAYVERRHDANRVADQLLELYQGRPVASDLVMVGKSAE